MRMSRRTISLGFLLTLVVLLWGASFLQIQALEGELEEMARAKVMGLRRELGDEEAVDSTRIGSRVVASRTLLVFGRVTGKISIFIEHPVESRRDEFIEGFEFSYERSEDGWRQTESGRCTSELCTLEGKKVLEALDRH